MAGVKTFDPDQVAASFSGVPFKGYGPDTFITVSQNEDSFITVQGADGETTRVKTNQRGAIATVTLLQSSDINDILSGLHTLDVTEPNGAGVAPFQVADLTGRTLLVAAESWIIKPPDVSLARGVEVREWQFYLADSFGLIGGN